MGLSEQFSRNVEIAPSYTLTLGDSPSAAVSAAAKGSLRYNHAATRFEASVDGGAWAALSGTFGGSIAANQVAFGSGANTIAGNASLTWDNTLKKFAIDSSHTIASSGGLAWDALGLGGTLTLTGTTTVTALSLARLSAPTITAGSAVTVTDAATLTIAGAPAAGGSATITYPWALRIVSGAMFVPLNATAAIPAIAIGGPSIGLNTISPNRLVFITAGVQGPEVNASNQFAALNGIVSIPGFAFRDDPDSGWYRISENLIGGTTGSVLRFDFGPGGFAVRSGQNSLGSGDGLYFEYGGTVANTAKIIAITPGVAYRALQVDAVSIALRIGTDNGLFIDSSRNVVLHSAALATGATDGFLYITTVPGTPTGAATSYTGRAPLVIDSTNNLLYFRSGGAWVAAGAGTVTGTGAANRVAYWSGASTLAGSASFTWNGSVLAVTGDITASADIQASGRLLASDGSAAGPTHGFSSSTGLGGYRISSTAYGFATNGVLRMGIYSNAVEFTGPVYLANGTVTSPSLAFGGDGFQDSGLYLYAANAVAMASAGALRSLWDATGNFVLGSAALATNATDGFLYVTTCPGTPTGAATAYTGRAPLVVDSTNGLLYFRNGGTWIAATGALSGSGAVNRIAFWTASTSLSSDADLTFDGTTLGLDGPMNFLDSANPSAPSNGISLFSKANNLVSRDTDDCYHSVVPIGPSAGSATVHWEKWFRVTSAGTSTTFDISLTSLNGVNTQVNNGIFWIEIIWLNMQSTTYVFTRQRRACYRWNNTTSTIEEMAESALETLQLGAAGGDMTFAVSGTSDVRVTLSTSVADQIDGRCFARVLFADPA